jgi:hypothetical protein
VGAAESFAAFAGAFWARPRDARFAGAGASASASVVSGATLAERLRVARAGFSAGSVVASASVAAARLRRRGFGATSSVAGA